MSGEISSVTRENLLHQRDPGHGRNVGQPDESTVSRGLGKDELSEVLVHRDKHPLFGDRPFKEHSVPGVGTPFPGFDHVVPVLP